MDAAPCLCGPRCQQFLAGSAILAIAAVSLLHKKSRSDIAKRKAIQALLNVVLFYVSFCAQCLYVLPLASFSEMLCVFESTNTTVRAHSELRRPCHHISLASADRSGKRVVDIAAT